MESYLKDNFGEVKSKNSAEEALIKWRKLCGIVRNPKRRFRFTADLSKRNELAAARQKVKEKFRILVLVSKAAWQFISGFSLSEQYTVPEEVRAAGFGICDNELQCIVEANDVKKLRSHGGVNGIAEKLSTSTINGLSTDPDQLNCRQKIYGINKFSMRCQSFWELISVALQDKILIIDTIFAFVFLLIGIIMEGWQGRIHVHDALVIVASVSLVVFVTATNDSWQSSQFRNWEMEKKKFKVHVIRDGFRQQLPLDDLLPGDVVYLTSGDKVPADGLFVSGNYVLLDVSNLTGESTDSKSIMTNGEDELIMVDDKNPFMLSGSKVQEGSCKMMVTTVGMRTQWGKIMATLSEVGEDETPLQVKLNGVADVLKKAGIFFAAVTFAVLLQRLFTRKLQENTLWSWSGYDALEMFKCLTISFTIFVIALPEGLPLAITLNLAFAMMKMMNDGVLLQHLAACETMGLASNICLDMSGSLTTHYMTVVKSCIGMNVMEINKYNTPSSLCSEIPDSALKLLFQSIFNNTDGEIVINKSGKRKALGTPTERALLDFGLSLGGDYQTERQVAKLTKIEPFNFERMQMRTVLQLPGGGFRVHCKGDPEIVLAACDKAINSNGELVALNEASINHLKATVRQFSDEALQMLCLAYKELEDEFSAEGSIPASGYTCIAIVGIKYSIHPGVKESIAVCRSAGITVRMVTGDNIYAAKAIAKECGILTEDGIAIEGPDFREKSLEEVLELVPGIQVMAQAAPSDKHALVKHLHTTFGEIVAVTGGGIYDGISLREADIGVAMGISGTEVAKESADIINLDDSFSTVVTMITWGRSVIMNTQKFVQFQLTVTLVALILNFSSAWLTGNVPFSDVELLWVGLITDTLVAFALATEPADDDIMTLPTVGWKESVIDKVMWRNIIGQSFYQVSVIWFLQSRGKEMLHLDGPDSSLILDTFIFNSFVFCQVSNLISSRKIEKINVFKGIVDNHFFVTVLCCIVLFEITVIEFLGPIANTSHLTLSQWFVSILIGLLGIPVAAGMKMFPL